MKYIELKFFICLITITVLVSSKLEHTTSSSLNQVRINCTSLCPITSLPILETNDDLSNQALEISNFYRKMHSAPDLTKNADLTKIAQDYANKLFNDSIAFPGNMSIFKHSKNTYQTRSLGENLYMASNGARPNSMIVAWYNEYIDYDFTNGTLIPQTCAESCKDPCTCPQKIIGHFTQLVWKNSTQVGFGFAGKFAVANYFPAGNYQNQYTNNVKAKIK